MNATATMPNPVLENRRPAGAPGLFILSAGAIMLLAGTAKLINALAHPQMLNVTEPLSGLRFLWPIAFVGIAQLIIAYLCLFSKRRNLALGLMAWLILSLAAYRVGAWTMGWHHPYPFLGSLIGELNVSPVFADAIIAAISAYLLVGAAATFWQDKKAAQESTFQKMPCPACGGHVKYAIQDLGRQIPCPHCQKALTLELPHNLKMSCYFCSGHIEFPAHAVGEKLQCPHCKKDITLREAT